MKQIVLKKCSYCGNEVERSLNKVKVTCFRCKKQRNAIVANKRRLEMIKCCVCDKLFMQKKSTPYCSDKCRMKNHRLRVKGIH